MISEIIQAELTGYLCQGCKGEGMNTNQIQKKQVKREYFSAFSVLLYYVIYWKDSEEVRQKVVFI